MKRTYLILIAFGKGCRDRMRVQAETMRDALHEVTRIYDDKDVDSVIALDLGEESNEASKR